MLDSLNKLSISSDSYTVMTTISPEASLWSHIYPDLLLAETGFDDANCQCLFNSNPEYVRLSLNLYNLLLNLFQSPPKLLCFVKKPFLH